MQQEKAAFQTTRAERVAYPFFGFGQNMVYFLVTGYLALFLTDYLYLTPFTVSAIFLVAKVWDAVNDPLFGIVVDRVSFKKDKFRPWLRVSTIAIPVATVLMFSLTPGFSMPVRILLAVLCYVLWDVAYTISDVPVFSLLTAMTSNVEERTTLISRGSIASIVSGMLIIIVLAPQLETVGFLPVALIVAACAFLGMLPLNIFARERNRAPQQKDDKPSLRQMWQYLKGNKYLIVFFAAVILSGITNISLSLNNYVMIHLFGGLDFMALLTAIGVVPLLLVYLFMPKLTARIDRMLLYRISLVCSIVLNAVIFFVGPGNRTAYAVLAIVKTVIATPMGMLAFTFAMDCVEYGHYKTGQRREGITMSVQAFSNKIVAALSGALAMLVLGFTGFAGELQVQTAHTLNAMWFANYWVPIAGALLSLPLFLSYKLKSKDVQVMADINAGNISRAEGDALLSRKY